MHIRTELPARPDVDLVLIDRLEFCCLKYWGFGNPYPVSHVALIFDVLATCIEHKGRDGEGTDGVLGSLHTEWVIPLTRLRHESFCFGMSDFDHETAAISTELWGLSRDYRTVYPRVATLFAMAAELIARRAWSGALGGISSVCACSGLSTGKRYPGRHRKGEHRASVAGGEFEPRGGYGPLILDRRANVSETGNEGLRPPTGPTGARDRAGVRPRARDVSTAEESRDAGHGGGREGEGPALGCPGGDDRSGSVAQ